MDVGLAKGCHLHSILQPISSISKAAQKAAGTSTLLTCLHAYKDAPIVVTRRIEEPCSETHDKQWNIAMFHIDRLMDISPSESSHTNCRSCQRAK
jgi:hypothetical protein